MHANLGRIIMESGRVGIAFCLACFGTAVGAVVAAKVVDLGERTSDLAGIFTATYTGGSVNYTALIQSTGFDDANVISAATAVDNLMSAVFLACLALLPAWRWLLTRFVVRSHQDEDEAPSDNKSPAATGFSLAASLAFALTVVAVSDMLVAWLNSVHADFDYARLRYVFITLLAVVPATLLHRQMARLHGGDTLGLVLAYVFFGAIAAGADVRKLIEVAPALLGFVLVLLATHAIIVGASGYGLTRMALKFSKQGKHSVFALSLPELIIASNAAVLGATTAPALAAARAWPALATPGVLAGVAGYIVGTPLGLAVAMFIAG
jgi:uncharacterized membrane protein